MEEVWPLGYEGGIVRFRFGLEKGVGVETMDGVAEAQPTLSECGLRGGIQYEKSSPGPKSHWNGVYNLQ